MSSVVKIPFPIQAPQSKASQALPLFSTYNTGQAVWSPRELASYIDNGYKKNWVLFTAVQAMSSAAAAISLNVYKRSDSSELAGHPVLDLLRRPSPFFTDADFFTAAYAYYKIAGNSYLEWSTLQEDGEGAVPQELYVLPPINMKVIAGILYVAGYRFEFNGQTKNYPYDIIKHKCRVLHWKTFNPNDNWYGMSACEAAAMSIDTHNKASESNKALLDNGMRPCGALVYAPKGEDADDTLTDEQYKTLKTRMDENWSGSSNRGRPLLLEGGLQWQQMSLTPDDMDFLAGKNTDAIGIANALNYPPFLLGLDTGQATFNNVAEAKVALYEDGILPMVDSLKKKMTNWLAPYFGDDWYIDYDPDMIAALQPKRDKVWARLEKADWLTPNEKREETKYAPRPDGDVILVSSLLIPLADVSSQEGTRSKPSDDSKEVDLSEMSVKNINNWLYEEGYLFQTKDRDTTELLKQLRIQKLYTKGYTKKFEAFLKKQAGEIGKGYGSNGKVGAKAALSKSEKEMKKLLTNLYKQVMSPAGKRVLDAFKDDKAGEEEYEQKDERTSIFEMTVADWIEKHSTEQITNISAFTQEKVRSVLLESVSEGLGAQAIGRKIEEALGGEFARNRADTIARTEVHQSFNVAGQEAAKATGLDLEKKWLSINDDRTRDSHKAVNAEVVGMDEKFKVGSSKLLYPGDPEGEAGEVINCRCGIRHIPKGQ